MRQKRQFTLLELMVVIMILGIVVTIGIPMTRNSIESAKAKVCTTNLIVLQAAIEAYAVENDILPATLSRLQASHYEKAWAQVLRKENPLLIKVAYFIVDFDICKLAYAEPAFIKYMGGNRNYLRCPSDHTGHSVSYGINRLFETEENRRFKNYRQLKNSGALAFCIADSENAYIGSFSEMAFRHSKAYFLSKPRAFAQYTHFSQGALRVNGFYQDEAARNNNVTQTLTSQPQNAVEVTQPPVYNTPEPDPVKPGDPGIASAPDSKDHSGGETTSPPGNPSTSSSESVPSNTACSSYQNPLEFRMGMSRLGSSGDTSENGENNGAGGAEKVASDPSAAGSSDTQASQ